MTDTRRDDEQRGATLAGGRQLSHERGDREDLDDDGVEADDDRITIANPSIGTAERRNVLSVLQSNELASGDVVTTFERAFSEYCGVDHGVATANGTAALHAGLHAAGIGAGDRVLTTPFSFIATANAVRLAGAEPVFADIDPATYSLDPDAVERRITDLDGDVDAILAVHLYGLPAPVDALREIADAHDALLIEDAAQAHGARYRGEHVGTVGDLACFSFYPTKNMTTGEGGMVVTDRSDVERSLRRFVNHGRDPSNPAIHREVGHNFRMTNLAAALGHVQLERLDEFVQQRRRNASILTKKLAAVPVQTPVEPEGFTHAYHQYTIRCDERDALATHLAEFGIDTGLYYETPIHQQPAYSDVTRRFEHAERAAAEVLSLPVHPDLTPADLQTIATAIEYYFQYE